MPREPSAGQAIYPHLPTGMPSEVEQQRARSVEEGMFGHLKKQANDAKAKEEEKARSKKFAEGLKELNAQLGRRT